MYELIRVSDRCYYIDSPAKVGVLELGKGQVCLIDRGNDKDAGKRALKVLNAQGWQLKTVYNTHSHADHIGGNGYLQRQTGCEIFAPGLECAFANAPILEPISLFGANPPGELKHKFLLAQESRVRPLEEAILPEGLTPIPLPGHSFAMVGYRTGEDVVFLADALASRETLDKYAIAFVYDVGQYLATLEGVKTMEARCFIPAHAPVTEDIRPLAQYNIEKVQEVAERILALCSKPSTFETLLQGLFACYGLTMNFQQHALVGSTLRSYLTWLKETGRLAAGFENNLLLWERC